MEQDLDLLENLVRKELEVVDIYKHNISLKEIPLLKKHFRRDIVVEIKSKYAQDLKDLSNKYIAVFRRK